MQKHCRSAIPSKRWASALVVASVLIPVGAQTVRAEPTLEQVSVCELLKHATSYRGKVVKVVGVYWYGLRQSCSEPLVTRDHTWPSALNLVDSRFSSMDAEPAPFKTDQRSWDQLDALVMREAKAGRREEIWVTIVGVIRAQRAYIRENGQVAGGYGHLGVFPAELVVERISNITIKNVPTYDYRELLRRPGLRGGRKER